MTYAHNTKVDTDTSLEEIQRLLRRYGAGQFLIDYEANRIGFTLKNRKIIFTLPQIDAKKFEYTPNRKIKRNETSLDNQINQAVRQQWRALLLVIKAKLEAIESGITTLDQEFMGFYVLRNGQTLAEAILPQLDQPDLIPKLPSGGSKHDSN